MTDCHNGPKTFIAAHQLRATLHRGTSQYEMFFCQRAYYKIPFSLCNPYTSWELAALAQALLMRRHGSTTIHPFLMPI